MRVETTEELIQLLRRSKLLSKDQLQRLPDFEAVDAKTLVRRLHRRGWITRWQGLTLLEGRGQFYIGKYKLLDLIGTGGMGAVFKAMRPEIGRLVAVKVLRPKVLKKFSGLPRFLREIRSAASLDHPNIVQAYDAEETNGTYIMVMEYVEGRDLKAYITAREPMSIPWICECMRQSALGLQHAADRGTVHRDIKPANLIVSQPDRQMLPVVKILDFGLARFVSESEEDGGLTRVGQAVGTPDYIAPEQAQNSRSADIRADIYSLGCTFFELLTGQVPYPVENLTEKLLAHVRFDAPRVRELRRDIPPEIDAIVAKMLRRNPAERYQTADDLARALTPYSLSTGRLNRSAKTGESGSSSDWEIQTESVYSKLLDNLTEGGQGSRTGSSSFNPPNNTKSDWIRAGVIFGGAVLTIVLILLLTGDSRPVMTGTRNFEAFSSPDVGSQVETPAEAALIGIQAAAQIISLGGTLVSIADESTPAALEWPARVPGEARRWITEVDAIDQISSDAAKLVGIEIRGAPLVNDRLLARLTRLNGIEQLILIDCEITDDGLEKLALFSRLRVLNLSGAHITDLGLPFIGELHGLEELNLDRTKITGKGLVNLGELKQLRRLSLDFTSLGDRPLRHVEPLTTLEHLSLNGDTIPPLELTRFKRLPKLRRVSLEETNLGAQVLADLAKSLPNLEINQ